MSNNSQLAPGPLGAMLLMSVTKFAHVLNVSEFLYLCLVSTTFGYYRYTGDAGRVHAVHVRHVHPLLSVTLRLYRKHTM